ncbi:MAG: hypothetical protein KI786_04410 [Mameliella sp.]|nr:hypothetical protein [Phaeodactylibacter sp.]
MKTNVYILLICFLGLSFNAIANGNDLTWTGDGDGWRWEDAANWDLNQVPAEYHSVFIGGSAYVQITDTDTYAYVKYVKLYGEATLFLNEGTKLYVHNSSSDAFEMFDASTLVNWGELSIDDTGWGSSPNGLTMRDEAKVLNRGDFYINDTGNKGDGIDMEDNTAFVNRGLLSMYDIDEEGIDMDDDAFFRNRGTIDIDKLEDDDGIDMDDDDTLFENFGSISISDVRRFGEGIEVDDGTFINAPNGEINLHDVSGDVIEIQDDGTLENYGIISLTTGLFGIGGTPNAEEEETVSEFFNITETVHESVSTIFKE